MMYTKLMTDILDTVYYSCSSIVDMWNLRHMKKQKTVHIT